MQSNLDQKGRIVRLIWGVMCLLAAAALCVLGYLGVLTGWWVWVAAGVCVGFGALGIFSARKKWCAVRAMGIKTPM